MEEKSIRVLVIDPLLSPVQTVIANTLKEKQRIVGGKIAVINPFDDAVAIICNNDQSEGTAVLNRRIGGRIFLGTLILVGTDPGAESFVSLTDAQIDRYTKRFLLGESYVVPMPQNALTQ